VPEPLPSGRYVEYRGRRLAVLVLNETKCRVRLSEDDWAARVLPDALRYGTDRHGRWAELPLEVVERRLQISSRATWKGLPVTIGRVMAGEASIFYDGDENESAAELGMKGRQFEGWQTYAPVDELDDVHVDAQEVPLPGESP
jgi:hypothetical protein